MDEALTRFDRELLLDMLRGAHCSGTPLPKFVRDSLRRAELALAELDAKMPTASRTQRVIYARRQAAASAHIDGIERLRARYASLRGEHPLQQPPVWLRPQRPSEAQIAAVAARKVG